MHKHSKLPALNEEIPVVLPLPVIIADVQSCRAQSRPLSLGSRRADDASNHNRFRAHPVRHWGELIQGSAIRAQAVGRYLAGSCYARDSTPSNMPVLSLEGFLSVFKPPNFKTNFRE